MESKAGIMELEDSKRHAEHGRFGDQVQQQQLTRSLLLKLDFRYVLLCHLKYMVSFDDELMRFDLESSLY